MFTLNHDAKAGVRQLEPYAFPKDGATECKSSPKQCRPTENSCNVLANRPGACNAVALSFGLFLSVRLQKKL
jgi:hypothetical protein